MTTVSFMIRAALAAGLLGLPLLTLPFPPFRIWLNTWLGYLAGLRVLAPIPLTQCALLRRGHS